MVLICTSGSAGLNYAPAVAEAYFQQVPLLVLTADRPPEWIDQLDGQTIRQRNLYGAHAKGSFDFPVDTSLPDAKWHSERIINEAINLAQAVPAGPVQVNVPLREPFYPQAGAEMQYEAVKIIRRSTSPVGLSNALSAEFAQHLQTAKRILVVVGQRRFDASFNLSILAFAATYGAPIVADSIANIGHESKQVITRHDVFLAGLDKRQRDGLKPDLLITVGQSLISKSLKLFLREAAPAQHWHLQEAGETADTFRSLTSVIQVSPEAFFAQLQQPSRHH